VDTDAVVERLFRRAEIEGRSDDNADTIRRRMEVYAAQTAPLTQEYAKRGLLVQVDGMGTMDEVTDRIVAALGG
jgi:adenylate kinase